MSDQCKHCVAMGDYETCISTPCNRHESWIDIVRINRIKNLKFVAMALREYIDAIPSEAVATFPTMPGIDRDFVDEILGEK